MATKPVPIDHKYAVYAGLSFTIVIAPNVEAARKQMLMDMGLERKPWLGRDWEIHRATGEELRRYAAFADNTGKSKPTAKLAKNPKKPTIERLL